MLAIKECLIREGVLNLDSPIHGSSQRHFQLQSSKSSGNMDMPRYRKTITTSSDLSAASATAKTSSQHQAHKQQQQQLSDESVASLSRVSYRGQHPHFHHHTTPAYYTDLQLRIHTPNASDVGALNENYQSVYSTPSTQLVEQRCFPKSSTATVAPPPIDSHAQSKNRASFFRLGDSASTDNSSSTRRPQNSKERCAKSLPPTESATKGEGSSEPATQRNHTQSPQNPIASPSSCRSPVVPASQLVIPAATIAGTNSSNNTSGRSSRLTQRFQQRSKRAVRVRSESRPISALYDIICKEKGLDVGDSSTSSSRSNSNEKKAHQKATKKLDKSDTLATFWPLNHQYHIPSMSSANQQPEQLDKRQQPIKQKRIRLLPDGASSEDDNEDESPYALHSSQKVTNLSLGKANSLPPTGSATSFLQQTQQHLRSQPQPQSEAIPRDTEHVGKAPLPRHRTAKSLEPVAQLTGSQPVSGYNEGNPISVERLIVEPPKLSLSELNSRIYCKKQLEAENQKQEQQELKSPLYDQGEVLETLARWQQELCSTANDKFDQLINGANGHHHYSHQREYHHHDHELSASPTSGHSMQPVAVEGHHQTQPQSKSNHHLHHQATNARRFITRTPRSRSRQSAGHSSPPPPAGYHSDSSYSSPSPTRAHHKEAAAATEVASGSSIGADPQSSANGNSSAYETAATTVMTHAKPEPEQLYPQHVEVPMITSPSSQTNTPLAVIPRYASGNTERKKEEDHLQQRQRYSSPSSLRISLTPPGRRLSSSELSPKCSSSFSNSGFHSEPSSSASPGLLPGRSASQAADPIERRPLVATFNNVSMKQNLSELHYMGGVLSPPKVECTLRMRPRSSTMCAETEIEAGCGAAGKPRDNLTNLQLSPVQKHKRTPEASPLTRRGGDRDKSAKRKSNLNRSYNEEATKDSDEAASTRRRRRRELGMARTLMPGDDESLHQLLQSPPKSSCSESTSKSESLRQARGVSQKINDLTNSELTKIKKIAEQAQVTVSHEQPLELKMSPILRRKSTDELVSTLSTAVSSSTQSSPPAPSQIVSILKKKEHAFGECNSSASSNASPVTFSATVLDTPLPSNRSKRQGILKKRSSLDESRYYSRSHSPDERSIFIKSARRNSLEEAGSALSSGQAHGILKQSSYDSGKSDGCPSANESQPHSILKKKDSLSTPSDGGSHKHVSISQAVTLAAAELAAHDDNGCIEDGDEHEIPRPILKQESTSSEEAVRPPKPILKKKSFGEADEHEIRPILKSSRKSSREEFDLSELSQDAKSDTVAIEASSMRPILKTDSPSKRRSLGSTQPTREEITDSLLKRRTRSLERQDGPPIIDLAAALNAISNSQAASVSMTPVDFVTTPSNISVAERIKHMERLSTTSSQSASSGGINSSWESPLQQAPQLHESSAAPKLLKPSVLRRDLYKDRYKTQPVTSEEKSFFKANSTPFDISTTSAFKPTKPLDIRIGAQIQQHPLISPITGQPLSHVPAPFLLSSSTLSGAGSSFRLARSSTQPLQSPRVVHLAGQGHSAASPLSSILTSSSQSLTRQHSTSDSVSLSEQLTLSVGNDSEHIFEMSGLDNDSAIQSLGEDASTATTQSSGVGLARSSSVRARANMFQQLQEQARSQRETAGREQLPQSRSFASSQATTSRQSPPPGSSTSEAAASQSSPLNDDSNSPNTTQDTTDADFEPSSLSLAERLAFFSSLCESASCGSGGATAAAGSARLVSRGSSSYASRSPPNASMERTPRSSIAGSSSSTSVTPTPMECTPVIHELRFQTESCQPQKDQLEQKPEQQQQQGQKLDQTHNGFHELSRSATAPTTTTTALTETLLDATPTTTQRRVRLRTVGKLVLPDTFLSDRNNNNRNNTGHRNSCLGRMQTVEDIHISMGVRTIGKIKSPFIEHQHMQLQSTPTDNNCHSKSAKLDIKLTTHSQTNSSDSGDDAHGSDSGKENCAANQQKQQQQEAQSQPLSEMRRKLSLLTHITVQQKAAPQTVNRRHTTQIGSTVSATAPAATRALYRSNVNERIAKYFGPNESFISTTTVHKRLSMPTNSTQPQGALNENVRLPAASHSSHLGASLGIVGISIVQRRRDLLKRTRAMSLEALGTDGSISPTAMPSPKRAHSPATRAMRATELSISSFEDIVITPDELHAASQEFQRLCGEILGT